VSRLAAIVYHASDAALAERLRVHLFGLRTRGRERAMVQIGDPLMGDVLGRADVILLCLSPSMLDSSFLASRMWRSAKEQARRVIPVRARLCDTSGHEIHALQAVPHDPRSALNVGNEDEVGTGIARDVLRAIDALA